MGYLNFPGGMNTDIREKLMQRLGYGVPAQPTQNYGMASPYTGASALQSSGIYGAAPSQVPAAGRMATQTMMPAVAQPTPTRLPAPGVPSMPQPTPMPVTPTPTAPPAQSPTLGLPHQIGQQAVSQLGAQLNTAHPGRSPEWVPIWEGIDELPPEAGHELQQFINTLYAGGRYKDSDAVFQQMAMMKANEIRDRYKNGGANGIDYSGMSKIGDQFSGLRDQLMASLSARGIGGSGIEAGAQSRLSGMEGIAEGDYIRGLTEQRRQEKLARDMAEKQMLMQLLWQGHEQRVKEQSNPGVLGDILGIVGQVAPYALGALFPPSAAVGAGFGGGASMFA